MYVKNVKNNDLAQVEELEELKCGVCWSCGKDDMTDCYDEEHVLEADKVTGTWYHHFSCECGAQWTEQHNTLLERITDKRKD